MLSQKQNNWLAIISLIVLILLDLRYRLGLVGLFVALGVFLAIISWNEIAPRIGTKIRMARRSAKAFEETEQCVEKIKSLLNNPRFMGLSTHSVRQTLLNISEKLEETADVIRADPDKHRFIESFAGSYAKPVHDLVDRYVTLTVRRVESAKPELAKTEAELPEVLEKLHAVFEGVHRGDISQLKSITEMLDLQTGGESL